ncbi:MAG: MATE family efflux transporter [Firmicutes bacterium]|nr:MATE family efflux transporter [[Eubacterium] siraeum]MCM1489174.1 MATE family efflux transporter [Bacillota bacterium]
MNTENKMATNSVNRLIWTMGLPMILSMVLQALYNVVDTIFVINSNAATQGNAALTAAFPIQILIIAVGVGTGVGINAMLSRKLGEGDRETVNRVAGNGIFLAFVIYAVFLLFGLFLAKPYMRLMSSDDTVIGMGAQYLQICCCLSFGAVGFTVYERFLQATGKTVHSMAAQIAGAVCNIILDYLFVLVFDRGVSGAAWATVIGQMLSLLTAMILHYSMNKEIDGHIRYIRPVGNIIKTIYRIGIPAAVMQALLAIMMFIVLQIFKVIDNGVTAALMVNAYGIYYKIMQIALFACFGLSNTLITVVSFNYGMKNKERLKQTLRFGILNSVIVSALIMLIFQIFTAPTAQLFGLSLPEVSADGIAKADILSACETAMHISTLGYIFMGVSVAVQGILQGLRNVYKPIVISLLRLIIFVVPFALIFCTGENPAVDFWWTFVIAEILTSVCSLLLLKKTCGKVLADL